MNFPENRLSLRLLFFAGNDMARILPCSTGEKVPKIAPRSDSFDVVLFCISHGISDGVSGAVKPLTSGFVRTKTLLAKIAPCL